MQSLDGGNIVINWRVCESINKGGTARIRPLDEFSFLFEGGYYENL